ncbi:unnamed protein product [Cylicocyclus nassatus]|uniref:DUF7774 domain-containing protein n=1 Tax=Cylicocyclus nassatus TaxID=53992 RepID=A0AA36H6Q1_CYLNA|nr:unnamed protein product [Cylicocyclus nassatus]
MNVVERYRVKYKIFFPAGKRLLNFGCLMSHGRRHNKKLLISRQLEKRKDLIRLLFRACGDRTVGVRFLSKERLEDNELENVTTKTVFEKIEAAVRPVTYPVQTKKFKWKSPSAKSPRLRKGSKRHRKSKRSTARARSLRDLSEIQIEEEKQEKSLVSLSAFTLHQDFISAYKVMTFIKQHNLLDKTLSDEDTGKVRQFFETELSRPSYRVMRLMHEAFNKCWERVIDLCEKADFTNEVRLFLSEREKAKACFLDVMLIFPDLIPEFWGGRHIVEISMPFKLLQTIKDQIYVEDDRSPAQDLTKSVEQSHLSRTTEYTKTTAEPTITAEDVNGEQVFANTVPNMSPASQKTREQGTKSVAKTPKLPGVKQTKHHSKAEKADKDVTAREQAVPKKQDQALKDTAKPKTPKPDSQQVQKDMKKEKITLKVERPLEMDMRKRKIIELKQSEKKLEKTMTDVKQRAKAVEEKKKPVPPQSTQEASSDEDEDDANNGREAE